MTSHRIAASLLAAFVLPAAAFFERAEPFPPDARLGPAPWADPAAPPPQLPRGPTPKAVASVPAINTADRAAVLSAYNLYYNLAMPPVGFTGSTAGCNPGAISLAFQEWTVTRINFLRAMAGVPGNTTLDGALNGQQQAAALIMAANGTLTHFPTAGMACYTQAGYDGAASSNLALGGGLTDSIPLYMTDPGMGNEVVGHRRWILHSRKTRFGLGQANGNLGSANALYTFDFGPSVSVPGGIPWPPRGHVPLALFPAPFPGEGQRWSFGLPGASFGAANVTMTVNNVSLPVTVISRTDDGYGDNTIVWSLPGGHVVVKESTYMVTISGVSGAAFSSYSYQVVPFDPADPLPSNPARLYNLSTRMQVLTGNDVMIGGFVISGSAAKTVVVRARGPSLVPFGITNALVNPQLQLVRSSDQVTIATNDDFGTASNLAQLNASGFAPDNALESAILISLQPGAYTAIVTGVGGGTGVGIVEVFEVDMPAVPLANISTRGQVLTANDVMIGGFVIGGSTSKTVVVRARGPSLVPFGITNALPNPTLQLVRSSDQAVLATNDDWQSAGNVAAIIASGFAPSDALESAILITLQPGAYTAIVSGAGASTGVGIVEVFAQ